MQGMNKFRWAFIVCLFFLLAGGKTAQAQERMTIQATAQGTSSQLGKIVNINIHIEQFSTQEDRKALIEAFQRSGQNGLVDLLGKMSPKGRVRFASGGVGNDVKYIIELPSKQGRRIRLVTDRNLSFGELYSGSRSADYDFGAIELNLTPDGKGTGTVLPACKLKVNKKTQEIEVETFQFPWKLTNFTISKD